jgi:hypothetical protein
MILSRRVILRLGGAAGVVSMMDNHVFADAPIPAKDAVDHLLLGASDLDQGIAWVETLTGVRASVGGRHPGRGTRNALLSFGRRQYLEIIAPDPTQTYLVEQYAPLKELKAPRLFTWAAATKDMSAVVQRARTAGYQIGGPSDGSRTRPDGRTLKWKTMNIGNDIGALIPFFIEWGADTVHPSEDSPSGCSLESFYMEHPDPSRVGEMLARLGIEAQVSRGPEPRLIAVIRAPKGRIQLT